MLGPVRTQSQELQSTKMQETSPQSSQTPSVGSQNSLDSDYASDSENSNQQSSSEWFEDASDPEESNFIESADPTEEADESEKSMDCPAPVSPSDREQNPNSHQNPLKRRRTEENHTPASSKRKTVHVPNAALEELKVLIAVEIEAKMGNMNFEMGIKAKEKMIATARSEIRWAIRTLREFLCEEISRGVEEQKRYIHQKLEAMESRPEQSLKADKPAANVGSAAKVGNAAKVGPSNQHSYNDHGVWPPQDHLSDDADELSRSEPFYHKARGKQAATKLNALGSKYHQGLASPTDVMPTAHCRNLQNIANKTMAEFQRLEHLDFLVNGPEYSMKGQIEPEKRRKSGIPGSWSGIQSKYDPSNSRRE